MKVELVVVERKGAVGAAIVSVQVRITTGQVVTPISNMTTQGLLGDLAPRRGGQGDGVSRLTRSFHWRCQGEMQEVEPYLADVWEKSDGDGTRGDSAGGDWVLLVMNVGD